MDEFALVAYLHKNLTEAIAMREKYARTPLAKAYWDGVINTIEATIKKVFELEAEG